MVKNIVFLHMEALQQMHFWQYQAYLPALWKLRDKSMYFSRCYASGTTTIFTLGSLYYGSLSDLDGLNDYDRQQEYENGNNFLDYLRGNYGYRSAFFTGFMASPTKHRAFSGYMPRFDDGFTCVSLDDWAARLDAYFNEARENVPFFIHAHFMCDPWHLQVPSEFFQENVALDIDGMTAAAIYMQDRACAVLLDALEKRALLDSTVIVAFGDHGCELVHRLSAFYRGMHSGTNDAWVPLIICNSPLGSGVDHRLAALDDLPATLSRLLFPESPSFKSRLLFPGLDLTREKREFVVTQNKYALQAPQRTYAPKSYGITDGTYRLIVSEVDREARTGGLELYDERLDPYNQLDLLEYFEFNDSGGIIGISADALENHRLLACVQLMNPLGLSTLAKRYGALHRELRAYVLKKERESLKKPGARPHVMPEESFVLPVSGWNRNNRGGWKGIAEGMRKFVDMGRPVLLYGYPNISPLVMAVFAFYGVETVGFIDGNAAWHNMRCSDGLMVYSPEDAARKFPQAIVVSCLRTDKNIEDAGAMMRSLGMEHYSYVEDVLGSMAMPDPGK